MKLPYIGCLLLCVASVCRAQERVNFPWWNSPVTQEIGLSGDQSQKIRQIVHSYRNRLLDARNDVLKARGDLEDILNGPTLQPSDAKPAIDRLTAANAASNRVLLEMSVQLRSVLTLDQWRQLVRRWDDVKKKRPSDTQVPP
ncbi:MAG TPA: periplasmic heavy metal sensor [Bryobacteraceae bacterium]|nr:periplasmic heavy metal sensor [Bryobacteraceae bacterium]